MDETNTILDDVRENSAISKGSSKGKLCKEFQNNNLSSPYVESWILECLDMLGITDNARCFLEKSKNK